MIVRDLQQGTAEWLAWRGVPEHISASLGPTILGECEYETDFDLWVRRQCIGKSPQEVKDLLKLHGVKPEQDFDRNPWILRGKRLEDTARQAYEEESGITGGLSLCIESSTIDWLKASLDWYVTGHVTELKCPHPTTFKDVKARGTRSSAFLRYRSQVQVQMIAATDENGVVPKGELVFYCGDTGELIRFEIRMSPTRAKKIIAKLKKFHKMVLTNKPPEKDPDRDAYVPTGNEADIWRPHCESVTGIDDELAMLNARVKELKEQREADCKVLSDSVKAAGFKRGKFLGVNITCFTVKGSIDNSEIVKSLDMMDEELDLFRKQESEQVRVTTTNS